MRRNPQRFDKYINTHHACMRSLRAKCFVGPKSFVGDDTLEPVDEGDGTITLSGEIACLGGIVIRVDKTLQIVDGEGPHARVRGILHVDNVLIVTYHQRPRRAC